MLNVEQSIAILGFTLDVNSVKVVAPEVAFGAAEAVHVAGVEALEVLHESRNGTAPEGFEHEVDVVGHEAEGMDADFVAAREEVEPVEVEQEMGGGVEGVLPLGSALVDVVDVAAFPFSEAGRVGLRSSHSTDKWVAGAKLLIYFAFIFASQHMQETSHSPNPMILILLILSPTSC